MEKLTFEVPAMYGDHHVSEVRRILLEIPGVEDVYASSAFRIVEVSFDPNITSEPVLEAKMQEAGYLGEWLLNTESGKAVGSGAGSGTFMRYTMVNEQVKQVVGFAQKVSSQGRPLWPCPGMGPISGMDEEK
jgi:copper chaperone CopZ